MEGPDAERWHELCAKAAVEQNPDRLMEFIEEINRLLKERLERKEYHATATSGNGATGR